jgi:DNA-binding LacI/PurR family transcriptional regulator
MRRLATFALWLSTALLPPLAWAESPRPHTAVLVVPQNEDVVVREIVARLRGELAAAGFTVSVAERENLARPREEIERTAGESSATAVIMVRPERVNAHEPRVNRYL